MKKITLCRFCSGCCPVEVDIENERIVSVKRIKKYSDAIHQICPKVEAASEILYSPKRLKNPLLKDGEGKWGELEWKNALALAADMMNMAKERYGAQSVCWLRGQAPDWGGAWQYAMRLMQAFGSPNALGNGSVCHAGREAIQTFTYGKMTSPDYKNSNCIMIWGRNDRDTNPSSYEDLLYARANGAKLIVIDPVKTELAVKADLWLPIKPGTDGFLAMAMMYWLISERMYDQEFVNNWTIGFNKLTEEAEGYSPQKVAQIVGISAEQIIAAVKCYTDNQPACIAEGNGLDMHTSVAQVTRAIALLRTISGNLDRKGGDLIPQPIAIRNFQLRASIREKPEPISNNYPLFSEYDPKRGIHVMGTLIDAILEEKPYPIKGLIVQGANPAVTMANVNRVREALQRLDFLIVIDPVLTQTGLMADLVLPACYSFEQTMVSNQALTDNRVRLHKRVVPPYGQSLPDWEITFRLARTLGLGQEFPWSDVEEAIAYQIEPSGIKIEDLLEKEEAIISEKTRYRKYLTEGFKTPSGKAELASTLFQQYGYAEVPNFWEECSLQQPSFSEWGEEYPLLAITGQRPNHFVHSQFRHITPLREKEGHPVIDIHPDDSKVYNINTGNWVRVSTPMGSITMRAEISTVVSPGTIRIAWGWGEDDERYNVNLLTDDFAKDKITSTTPNRAFKCKIEKYNISSPSLNDLSFFSKSKSIVR